MTQIAYRANLSSAVFPMTLAKAGRSVIIPGPDQNFDKRVDPNYANHLAGIPQAIYMENVLPTPDGYQSVGFYEEGFATNIPTNQDVEFVIRLPIKTGVGIFSEVTLWFCTDFVVRCSGPAFLTSNVAQDVVSFVGLSSFTSDEGRVFWAVVRGVVYVLIKGTGPYSYELYELELIGGTTVTLTNITASVTGLAVTSIECICAAYNYLIANTTENVYWSSTTTPTDFVASLVSGAGFETPTNHDSHLRYVFSSPSGFFVYTLNNVIRATYTGNARYPFKFKEILGSSPVFDSQQIASTDTNDAFHAAISATGQVQLISSEEALTVLPEVTDYLQSPHPRDEFNYTSNSFSTAYQITNFNIYSRRSKIKTFMGRYLLVSCDSFNHEEFESDQEYKTIIVFDNFLKRYGKLKIDHTHVFPLNFSIIDSRPALGVVNKVTRKCHILTLDVQELGKDAIEANGGIWSDFQSVLVLGKFQLARSNFIILDEMYVECPQDPDYVSPQNFNVLLWPTIDGKNFINPVIPYTDPNSAGNLKHYMTDVEARNISVMFKGAFDLSCIDLIFHVGGKA